MKPDGSTCSPIPSATEPQVRYMEVLFNDCGFDTRKRRLDYLHLREIEVNSLDEMTVRQASVVIEDLMKRKEENKPRQCDHGDCEVDGCICWCHKNQWKGR